MHKIKWNVDVGQWRALVRTGLRHDLRRSRFLSGTGRKTIHPARALILVGLFSVLLGVGFAAYAVGARSLLLASIMSCSSVMFIAASMILVEYYAIILSPDDFHVLGHLPMTSQTYFAGKLANLLIYILGFATLSALPAAVGFMIRSPFSLWRGAVAFFCMLVAAFTAAMAMVLFYTALSRLLPQRPLKYIISFVQVVASFLIYGGYALMPRLVPERWLDLSWQPGAWHLLIPSAWFGGFMQTLLGDFASWNLTATAICFVLCINAAYYGINHLAKNYLTLIAGQHEVNLDAAIEKKGAAKTRAPLLRLFRKPEERIIATLLSSQFRNDTKFRMAILTIVPLIAMYMFIAVQGEGIRDPFVHGEISSFVDNDLIYMAILLIPLMVKQSIEISDSFEAAWIFFASPTALHRLVIAAKQVSYVYFVMPTVMMVTALFTYFFEHPAHALLHGLTMALLAYIIQQFMFIINPRVPFSEPRTRGRQGTMIGVAFLAGPLLGIGALAVINKTVYAFPQFLPIFYPSMLLLCIVLERFLRWRMRKEFSPARQASAALA